MTPPIWLDAAGRPCPTRACSTCGREVEILRFRHAELVRYGWVPVQTLHIPSGCGCRPEYVPVPALGRWWRPVPIWEPIG